MYEGTTYAMLDKEYKSDVKYIYDNETELYYLQSRYYDPELGRFISADRLLSTGLGLLGYNMFAYCTNNPVLFKDDSGQISVLACVLIGAGIGLATRYICDVVDNIMDGKKGVDIFIPKSTLGEYTASTISGAATAIPGLDTVCDVVAPAIEQGLDYLCYGDEWDWEEYGQDAVENVVFSSISGSLSVDTPVFIRDVKNEARELGYKGTKQLAKYLNKDQWSSFFLNQFIGLEVETAGSFLKGIIAIFE